MAAPLGRVECLSGGRFLIEGPRERALVQLGERPHLAAAAAGTLLARGVRERFAEGDEDQQPPEVVAIVELGESPLLGAAADAVEGAQRDVLLVGHAPRGRTEPLACEAGESPGVAGPDQVGGGVVPTLESQDAAGDRALSNTATSPGTIEPEAGTLC